MINIDIINNINGECIVEIYKLHNYNCNKCNIEDNYNTCIECKENTIIEYINYNNINNNTNDVDNEIYCREHLTYCI